MREIPIMDKSLGQSNWVSGLVTKKKKKRPPKQGELKNARRSIELPFFSPLP